jgi:hypothetical protein
MNRLRVLMASGSTDSAPTGKRGFARAARRLDEGRVKTPEHNRTDLIEMMICI